MKSVSPQIYSLISKIQTFQSVASFSLAGGTSLALRYNHRVSEAIDFFSDNIVGVNGLVLIKKQLQKKYKDDLLFCELINEESGDQFCFLRTLIRNDNIQANKTCWQRKVKNFMIEKGLPIPPIKPIN